MGSAKNDSFHCALSCSQNKTEAVSLRKPGCQDAEVRAEMEIRIKWKGGGRAGAGKAVSPSSEPQLLALCACLIPELQH